MEPIEPLIWARDRTERIFEFRYRIEIYVPAEQRRHGYSLYFVFYKFCRIHKTLRVSPAMAAGITDRLWSLEDVIARIDADAPAPKVRGPYKKREA